MNTRRDAVRSQDELRDDPIDVGGYGAALRRSWILILVVVVLGTAGAAVASLSWPSSYEARAEVLVLAAQDDQEASSAEALSRELATLQSLVMTSSVLDPAADELGVGVSDLRDRVTPSADGRTSILTVAVRAGTAEESQDAADTVAEALIQQRREFETARLQAAIANLTAEIDSLGNSEADGEQRQALVDRRAQLSVAAATAGDDLALAQSAELPSEPASPRPVRDIAIGFFVSLVIAVLLGVWRDRVRENRRARSRAQQDDIVSGTAPTNRAPAAAESAPSGKNAGRPSRTKQPRPRQLRAPGQ